MREIQLTKGKVALVDDSDFESLSKYKWCYSACGYALRNAPVINGVRNGMIYMHRVLMGDTPFGLQIDHKDGNPLNNQRCNLRFCRPIQNQQNCKRPVTNTSGFKGVHFDRKADKWAAAIRVNKRYKFLGYRGTAKEAHSLYVTAASLYFKEFARFK